MKITNGKKIKILAIIIIVIGSLFTIPIIYFSIQHKQHTMTSITIAEAKFESCALFWIAEDQGFFIHNGLNVTPKFYTSGVAALDGLFNDEADIVIGTNEYPFVARVLQKENVSTVGCISKSEFIYIVARKDRGIENVSDLNDKTIGTTFRTIAEFFLSRYLELNGMTMQDIIVVDLKTPADWINAVVNGTVDAVVTAQPYAYLATDALGANASNWSVQSSRPLYTQVISTNEWIEKHLELIEQFLQSLMQAEEYLILHPDESKTIIQERLDVDAGYMETVWSQNQFMLSLDQSLVTAMEDEARWMIVNNLTDAGQIPDFVDHIYIDALKKIKPEAVNIIS